jgi:hypothetical protein
MKRQALNLKHVISLTVANTTDKQIEVNLFAPDVNGLENKYVRDDLSSIKVDYKQIQNHISKNDELISTVRIQVLNPKHDRLLFQTEGNEVIDWKNIHGQALAVMNVVTKSINGSISYQPIINYNQDWTEKPSILKDFNFEFIASKNTHLIIKIPPYTAYQIDLLRDSSLYLKMIRNIAPLNMDVYNALRDGFVLFNKLSEIVPISIDNSLPSINTWEIIKQKEQHIFKLLSDISEHIERNKTNSDIIMLYNTVKQARFLTNDLLEQTKKLIDNDKEIVIKRKQQKDYENQEITKYIKAAQKNMKGTKSVNFFDVENSGTKSKSRKIKITKTKPESFDPLNTKIKERNYKTKATKKQPLDKVFGLSKGKNKKESLKKVFDNRGKHKNHPTKITKPIPKKSVKKPIKKKGKK